MTVSPAQPSYLEYRIPADVWSVIVRAESGDDLCGVMSLQELKVSTSSSFPCFFLPTNHFSGHLLQLFSCVCLCVYVQTVTLEQNDFLTEIWHSGSPRPYLVLVLW